MSESTHKEFDKYRTRGAVHWCEYFSRDPRKFNAYLAARYEWILRLAGDVRGKRVLDLGCGDGVLSYLLAAKGADVIGADSSEDGLAHANKETAKRYVSGSCKFISASAYEVPLPDESFDVVVSCEVIEHLPEPEKMLTEARRLLKKGGKLILTTPYRITEFPQDEHHIREYFPQELRSFVSHQFADVEIKLTHHLLWRSVFTYAFRNVGNRPLGKWFINTLALYLGWNPFMVDYGSHHARFDSFATIALLAVRPL